MSASWSPAMRSALVAWDHHEGIEIREKGHWSTIRKMMQVAFYAGWNNGGGDERLAAIERLQELHDLCVCGDGGELPSEMCEQCKIVNELRKILRDSEVDE